MEFHHSIFRSYDVRGVYPDELNEQAAYAVGQALVSLTGASRVLVGRDMRLSGKSLQKELVRGITDSGADVDEVGMVPVEFQYWAVPAHGYDAGIIVTASHNPKEYNGFKMVTGEGRAIRGIEIRQAIEEGGGTRAGTPGSVQSKDLWDGFIAHILSFVHPEKIRPLKVVVDAGNGMAGAVMERLAPHLPIKIVPLFFEPDGAFPNRSSNPLEPGATDALQARVKEEQAHCGVAFDADCDRLFFIDEKGEFVQADMTLLLLARYILQQRPGSAVVHNLICSRAVPEWVERWGGKAFRSPVGYINVRTTMQEHNAVLGGEVSAHYSFQDNAYSDSGFIAFAMVMEALSQQEQPLSEIIAELRTYCRGDEVNFRVDDKQEMMDRLEAQYADAEIDKLDGVTFQYKRWWFNVRPSNTEPLLRLTVEADTCAYMEKKRDEIARFIEAAGGARA